MGLSHWGTVTQCRHSAPVTAPARRGSPCEQVCPCEQAARRPRDSLALPRSAAARRQPLRLHAQRACVQATQYLQPVVVQYCTGRGAYYGLSRPGPGTRWPAPRPSDHHGLGALLRLSPLRTTLIAGIIVITYYYIIKRQGGLQTTTADSARCSPLRLTVRRGGLRPCPPPNNGSVRRGAGGGSPVPRVPRRRRPPALQAGPLHREREPNREPSATGSAGPYQRASAPAAAEPAAAQAALVGPQSRPPLLTPPPRRRPIGGSWQCLAHPGCGGLPVTV